MKTAISIPDQTYKAAERLAKRLRISRSDLYARAVRSFVESHRDEEVTASLNRVYSEQSSGLDPVLTKIQSLSVGKESW